MGLKEITDPGAVIRAIEEYDQLGQESFLRKYGFGRAKRFLVQHDGKTYDAKAILGAAHGFQMPDLGPLTNDQFSGGEADTARKLRSLGFEIVGGSERAADDGETQPIGEIIRDVLALQPSWTKDNTPEMQERGRLVRKAAVRTLRALLPPASTLPFPADVEGQDGIGHKSRVPWVRVFSRSHSPSATTGWYVVLLFAADGSRAYLTIGSGTSRAEKGTVRLRPQAWLQDRITWARQVLAGLDTTGLTTDIHLGEGGELAAQYERGTLFARAYSADEEVDDSQFAAVLEQLLTLLSELYSNAEPESDEDDDALADQPVHLLLKWSPIEDPETIEKHLAAASQNDGSVWWGNLTKGSRKVRDRRVTALRDQIAAGVETFAYLYRSGPHPAAWRAAIDKVTNRREDTDERLPSYYGDDSNHSVYVLLRDIEPVDLDWVRDNVALASKPILGSLTPALRTQTSPLYVIHVGDVVADFTATHAPLSRDWLIERTLWSPEELDELLAALLGSSPQVILAGPPGTGKSWVAQAVARYLTNDRHRQWRLVQFHPSYAYENFIEGLRPVAEEGAIKFERVDGTVLRMAEAARINEQASHVLVLDEMNRANIPRVLGELMFLFEYRGELIDLQYSQGFSLPKNLLFIATMNTADRSIRSIDIALRRRFEIFECLPDPAALHRFYAEGLGSNFVPDLREGFVALNEALEAQLDRHHTIGQTFFMADEMTQDRLRRVWARKIFPLIEEYFFDLPDLANDFALERFWTSAGA